MKQFKLWTGGNVILNKAVIEQAKAIGLNVHSDAASDGNRDILAFCLDPSHGSEFMAMTHSVDYFHRIDLPQTSLRDFFSLKSKRTIYNPFSGEQVEVSEESYQALKASFE